MNARAAFRPYSVIIKPVSYICNLDCHYCYYLRTARLYPDDKNPKMTDTVLEEAIRQYMQQPIPQITFCWQGGEPTLMGIDFYTKALALIEKHRRSGQSTLHAFQTNGTLLDDEWCAFFKEHEFLIGISLDGPADLHDHYRHDKGGHPTQVKVLRGLQLLQKHDVAYNVLVLLNDYTVSFPEEVYNYLVDQGAQYIQFIPCLERDKKGRPQPYSVPPGAYGRFLNTVFDIWYERDVGKVFIQIVEENLSAVLGRESNLCVHARVCGRALVVEYNGDLYACDHFVDEKHRLGNIMETPMEKLVNSKKQDDFGLRKARLPDECDRCSWVKSCHGGCLKHRIFTPAYTGIAVNYFCEDYKAFYGHSYPLLYTIAQDLLARHRVHPTGKVKRNDPCPCGSGKKYKNCCGSIK